MNYKKGFTLIEILVVVSIIGIIAAVIITNLNSAKDKAVGIKSITELDQLKKALELYRNDNGKYPAEGENDRSNIQHPGWYRDGFLDEGQASIKDLFKTELVDKGYISAIPYYVSVDSDFNYVTRKDALENFPCDGKVFETYLVSVRSSKTDLKMAKIECDGNEQDGNLTCFYCFGQ